VVPEVFFSDREWKDFGDLLLAYGVDDFDLSVDVGTTPDAIPPEMLQRFAEDSIQTLGGDTKALVRLRTDERSEDAAADIPHYQFTIQPMSSGQAIRAGPEDSVELPYEGSLKVRLRGPGIETPLTTELDIDMDREAVSNAERDRQFINQIVYFFIGSPPEGGARIRSASTTFPFNLLEHRAGERAWLAAIQLGMTELLSRHFGLPYWRTLPEEASVAESTREALYARALERFESDPGIRESLLLSFGIKAGEFTDPLSEEKKEKVAQFRERFGDLSDPSAFESLYTKLEIESAASNQILEREPLKTRQFKSIWAKIGDGFGEFFSADPQQRKFLWFVLAMFLAMAVGSTLYNAAYYAQGIEIAPSYNGRTLVVAYRQVANSLINILTQIFLPLSLLPVFVDTREGNLFLVYVLAPIGLILAFTVFFGTRERTVIIRNKGRKPGFFRALREIGGLWEFWRITLLYLFIGYAIGSFNGLGNLLAIYYVFDGNMLLGASYGSIAGLMGTALAMLTIPLFVVLCNRIGKHNTLRLALGSLAIGASLKYFCYNPEIPELLFIPPFFYSPAIAGFYKVLSTMMGDVTDLDELRNGERREAMFGAVMAIIQKSLGSFTAIASGLVIVASGFEVAKGVHQDPGVFHNMLVLFSIVPGVASLTGFILLTRFTLTPRRVAEMKGELAELRRRRAEES
jgi:GPH family glycoside/pentoside/hexuronide:cation symporter